MQNLKIKSGQAFSQFDLTQNLLQNLYKFDLTPAAKLVLLYLSSCYNPKHADIFPKQKTIAQKTGISEASVIRAICELHKAGLIISERKYTNPYKFTSYFLMSLGISDNKMQVDNSQNESKQTCKLQPLYIEPKREQKNNTEILINYVRKRGAKNIQAYINTLKQNGSAETIIKAYKKEIKIKEYREKHTGDELKRIQNINDSEGDAPSESFKNLKKLWRGYVDNKTNCKYSFNKSRYCKTDFGTF